MKNDAEVLPVPAQGGVLSLTRHWLTIAQLALVLLVVYLYQIEGEKFFHLSLLTAGGFLVSIALPLAYRLRLFALLSIAGVLVVLGWADGAWLLALGIALVSVCHLPIAMRYRAVLLVVIGVGLAALRAGVHETPWSSAVWPILGSMFMFRTVLYLRALDAGQTKQDLAGTLSYFFMLPNVTFPLFPVVDYQTFRRTHFDKDEASIYQQGMLWIARGLLHLVLYRFVYYNVLNDPADVMQLGDLVQFMLGTFLLYLRVSGQFHLIVGVLHLFGFRLPETHKLYYLAHSFTELWRRINIYWTDFMMKTVFYPTYFRLKKLGPSKSVALATAAVFFTTWILHSYQWFWLRGGFPMTPQDFLFWAILGALVVRGALKELHATKAKKLQATGWNWRQGLRAGITFCIFCFLWSLWSTESVGQWLWTLSAAANVDLKGIVLLVGTFGVIMVLGARDRAPVAKSDGSSWIDFLSQPSVRTTTTLAFLLIIAQPLVQSATPQRVASVLASLQTTGFNAQDAARHHRGYYEQLDVRAVPNAAAGDANMAGREHWVDPASAGILRERNDLLERDLIPSVDVLWNGNKFTTNSFGMRDREYAREKPPGTLRIALLGPSHVMGNGVSDGETFEQLIEDRLNREQVGGRFQRFEILNFGVDGYTLPQELAMLQERALQFSPDIVLFTQYHRGQTMTEVYLEKIIWKNVPVTDPSLHALLERAGLADVARGKVPVPFETGRAIAGMFGVDTRMPHGESRSRVHRIAHDVDSWAIQKIADVARENGAKPVVLAMNAVIDDTPSVIPNLQAIQDAKLPVLDLFDVFPDSERAALRVAPWDEHPNATGHRLIAERLYGELLPIIDSVADGSVQSRDLGNQKE